MDSVLADINVDDGTTAITVDAEMADIIPRPAEAAKEEDKKAKKLAKKEKKLMKEGKQPKDDAMDVTNDAIKSSMLSVKSVSGDVGAASQKHKRKHSELGTEAAPASKEASEKKKKKLKHKHGKN